MRATRFLLSSTIAAFSLSVSLPAATSVQLPDPEITVQNINGKARFAGAALDMDAGRPALPVYTVTCILPPGAIPGSVSAEIRNARETTVRGRFDVLPAEPLRTKISGRLIMPQGRTLIAGRDPGVYQASSFYPASHVGAITTGELDGWKLAEVTVYPFLFNPKSGTLRRLQGGTLELSYTTAAASDVRPSARRSVRARLQALASNFNESYAAFLPKSAAAGSGVYVIITTKNIQTRSTMLAEFIAAKEKRGFTVKTITEDVWGGGTGNTAAENLRKWLKSNYQTLQIEYLLLIGNPHPTSGSVPMKMAYPSGDGPTDFYFAELSGNWDISGNGSFGEYRDFTTTGGADKYGEFLIGRIPYYTDADVVKLDKILAKTIRYESETDIAWRKNALIDMVPSDNQSPMWQMGEEFKTKVCIPRSWGYYRIYDQNYSNTNPELTPCSVTNTVKAWTQNEFGIVLWATHGSQTSAVKVIGTSNTSQLRDSFPSFTMESSCLNSHPETSNNLSYALLQNGCIGTLGCTRESIYQPGQQVFENSSTIDGICYMLARRMIVDSMTAGKSLAETRAKTSVSNSSTWLNLLITNLYGDPAVGAYTSALTLAFILVSPRAGDVFEPGEVIPVRWQQGPVSVASVKIEFSSDNGATWQTAAASVANTGSFDLTAPQVASSQCLVRLSDASDAKVTVTSPAFAVYQTATAAGTVTNGASLPQAEVLCINAAREAVRVTADQTGAFSFDKLIPGTYRLVAVAGAYASDTAVITVPPSRTGIALEIKAPLIATRPAMVEATVVKGQTGTARLVIGNSGKLSLTWALSNANAGSGVVINELYVTSTSNGQPDGYELWNRGPDIDISGWTLDSKDNQRTSMAFVFPAGTVFGSNKTLMVTDRSTGTNDTTFYIGNNLSWTFEIDTTVIYATLFDANDRVVDYFKSDQCTAAVPQGALWNGPGVTIANNSICRKTSGDRNDSTDWTSAATGTYNRLNPGQTAGSWTSPSWLSFSARNGTANQLDSSAVTLSMNTTDLALNTAYYDTVIITHNAANTVLPIRVVCRLNVVQTAAGNRQQARPVFGAAAQARGQGIAFAYSVPAACGVTVSLFDSRGRLLCKPIDAWHRPGAYTALVRQPLPPGVYYARFTAGATVTVQRLTLVR